MTFLCRSQAVASAKRRSGTDPYSHSQHPSSTHGSRPCSRRNSAVGGLTCLAPRSRSGSSVGQGGHTSRKNSGILCPSGADSSKGLSTPDSPFIGGGGRVDRRSREERLTEEEDYQVRAVHTHNATMPALIHDAHPSHPSPFSTSVGPWHAKQKTVHRGPLLHGTWLSSCSRAHAVWLA